MKAVLVAVCLGAGLLAAGCANGPRIVAAEVRTIAAESPGAAVLQNARYRFVTPAGAQGLPAQQRLQALAEAALARVGAVRDDANARLSVQVGVTVGGYWVDDWGSPYPGWSNPRLALGIGTGWRGGAFGFGFGWPMVDDPTPVYVTELQLLMRDLSTGQIVYDTRARHDGSSAGSDTLMAALLAAALEGYPAPGAALRRVEVPLLPASGAAPAAAAPASAPAPAR